MNPVPSDWALSITHIASEYMCSEFSALIAGTPHIIPPLELDFVMLAASSNISRKLADAYRNPGMIPVLVPCSF